MTIPASIAKALVDAQACVKPVEKDSTNAFHKYKYASSDDMVAVARDALVKSGLALARIGWSHQPLTEHEPARLCVQYMLTSADGDAWLCPSVSVPVLPEKGRPEDKAEAAALTYSHGYMVLGLLQMARVDEGHPDARDDRERGQYQRPEPRREQPAKYAPKAEGKAVLSLDTVADADGLLAYVRTKRNEWSKLAGDSRKRCVSAIEAAAERVGARADEAVAAAGITA